MKLASQKSQPHQQKAMKTTHKKNPLAPQNIVKSCAEPDGISSLIGTALGVAALAYLHSKKYPTSDSSDTSSEGLGFLFLPPPRRGRRSGANTIIPPGNGGSSGGGLIGSGGRRRRRRKSSGPGIIRDDSGISANQTVLWL